MPGLIDRFRARAFTKPLIDILLARFIRRFLQEDTSSLQNVSSIFVYENVLHLLRAYRFYTDFFHMYGNFNFAFIYVKIH